MPTVSFHFDRSFLDKLTAAAPDETIHITLSIDTAPPPSASPAQESTAGQAVAPQGPLAELLLQGLLDPGDVLSFQQRRAGRQATATVTAEGRLIVEGHATPYTSPSKAAIAVTGSPINGWTLWRTKKGITLDALRNQLQQD
ncbi:restriction system modified-DNA reader domain-containing protein (plasmid) [Streptomyces sp. WC2508]|uniref:restriction system modified-DNA reader domain-containing protein n=1 Tax=Streptomyces sp. WC2508 TaxID=3461405 RepID=UPI004044F7EA